MTCWLILSAAVSCNGCFQVGPKTIAPPPAPVIVEHHVAIPDLPPTRVYPAWQPSPCNATDTTGRPYFCLNGTATRALATQLSGLRDERDECRADYRAAQERLK